VLQLDASDELSALDIEALNDWIASRRVSAFDYDQVYGAMSLRIMRFYDRNLYHWEGRTHEVLVPTDGANFSTASKVRCNSKQLVVHHNQQKKERNYLAGLAMQVLEHPEKPRWWHFLGRELFYDRWMESAISVLEAHTKMEDAWPTERSQSWCFIGECLKALGRPAEAEEAYHRSVAIDPTRREPFLALAAVYSRRGEFANAVRWAREALGIPRTNAYPEVEANYTWRPHAFLYWNLFWLGRKDEAREHWEKFLSMVPEEHVPVQHARLFPPINKNHQGPLSKASATAARVEPREPQPQKEP
jgi:tetratricopeptide (TPR) repeat protein